MAVIEENVDRVAGVDRALTFCEHTISIDDI